MRVLALLDGSVADPESPLLRADDLGVQRGDGVFETILVVDGRPRELEAHLDRLERSARLLEMTLPERADWERAVRAVTDQWPWDAESEMALKLVCTRGVDGGDGTPTAFASGQSISAELLRKRAEGISVVTLERGIDPGMMERAPWLLLSAKTLSYAVNMAALREAERRGADEVVFTATDDSVLEGPTSNVVLVEGDTLVTPPPSAGILRGTTQGALFAAASEAGWNTAVEPVSVERLHRADGVWLASSIRRIVQVHTVDGAAIRADRELDERVRKLYESLY
ncbi:MULTISPECIES: aminodeoxychorismate lyase [unclassified Actinopolyspora]|uniref:aminodeoxychorismate lyase n=1 Tax=unclassified Actinopolyspora TaxID=2639451 RepID=UPI0013F621AB|nr:MULTISPECIES: aminodeoxychorismate lyase [unclassified Actinopolyspora]NHD16367.1 aminodeoxychorismate lyase [Actinopolyspora sp. BKK2]NHE75770.1 aminodeoxychorismate lyase [Actinopolyspora sp. BKK1]